MVKHWTKTKTAQGRKFISSSVCSPLWREVRAETPGRNPEAGPEAETEGKVLTDLLFLGVLFISLSYTSQEWHPSRWSGLSHINHELKCPPPPTYPHTDSSTGLSEGSFLTVKVSSSHMALACVELTKNYPGPISIRANFGFSHLWKCLKHWVCL